MRPLRLGGGGGAGSQVPAFISEMGSDYVAQASLERLCSTIILGRGAAASQVQAEPWDFEIIIGPSGKQRPLLVHRQAAGVAHGTLSFLRV